MQFVDSVAVASKSDVDVRRSTRATTTTTTTRTHSTTPVLAPAVQSGSERLRRLVREREMLVRGCEGVGVSERVDVWVSVRVGM